MTDRGRAAAFRASHTTLCTTLCVSLSIHRHLLALAGVLHVYSVPLSGNALKGFSSKLYVMRKCVSARGGGSGSIAGGIKEVEAQKLRQTVDHPQIIIGSIAGGSGRHKHQERSDRGDRSDRGSGEMYLSPYSQKYIESTRS